MEPATYRVSQPPAQYPGTSSTGGSCAGKVARAALVCIATASAIAAIGAGTALLLKKGWALNLLEKVVPHKNPLHVGIGLSAGGGSVMTLLAIYGIASIRITQKPRNTELNVTQYIDTTYRALPDKSLKNDQCGIIQRNNQDLFVFKHSKLPLSVVVNQKQDEETFYVQRDNGNLTLCGGEHQLILVNNGQPNHENLALAYQKIVKDRVQQCNTNSFTLNYIGKNPSKMTEHTLNQRPEKRGEWCFTSQGLEVAWDHSFALCFPYDMDAKKGVLKHHDKTTTINRLTFNHSTITDSNGRGYRYQPEGDTFLKDGKVFDRLHHEVRFLKVGGEAGKADDEFMGLTKANSNNIYSYIRENLQQASKTHSFAFVQHALPKKESSLKAGKYFERDNKLIFVPPENWGTKRIEAPITETGVVAFLGKEYVYKLEGVLQEKELKRLSDASNAFHQTYTEITSGAPQKGEYVVIDYMGHPHIKTQDDTYIFSYLKENPNLDQLSKVAAEGSLSLYFAKNENQIYVVKKDCYQVATNQDVSDFIRMKQLEEANIKES